MPYIDPKVRTILNEGDEPRTAGEYTYAFYKLMIDLLSNTDNPRFVNYHNIIGAVEAAKLEFYRRHVAPYEDKKIEQNGDVT